MTAVNAPTLDVLRMPLHGRQVIEASAGTGKTWTLAALYVRLVLGHGRGDAGGLNNGLLPPNILVMTFTEAATAELRERIRLRLSQAAHCFDVYAQGGTLDNEDRFTRDLRESIDPQWWPRCALQLHSAADWMDEAAIYTLHGWSRRMLSQHALASGHLFEQTHLDDAARIELALMQDYWRQWLYPMGPDTLSALRKVVGDQPQQWLKALRKQWHQWKRTPVPHALPTQTPHDIAQALQSWQMQCRQTAQTARAQWNDALWQDLQAHRLFRASADNHQSWIQALAQWATTSEPAFSTDASTLSILERFTFDALQEKNWPAVQQHAFFASLQTHVQAVRAQPEVQEALTAHAAHHVAQAYALAKQQRAAFDFDDLITQLHASLTQGAQAAALAQAIREQYPVALVDEFQDTDPWQYESLDRIYAADAVDARHAFIMIGDPKQAIYRFRGADLGTYLRARSEALQRDANALHTLDGNHRSSAALLRAIEHVFTRSAHPFNLQDNAEAHIAFVPVQARADVAPWDHPDQRAMTVWQLPPPAGQKTTTLDAYLHSMSQIMASHMVDLLNQGLAQPGDMAVLVRRHDQAQAMAEALRARGVPSVYLSDRSSVYATDMAIELWRVLRAVASPRDLTAVRSAVASALWGLSVQEVQACFDDATQWEALLNRCHAWHQRWQQQGLLPMLYDWLHSEHIAQRLLATADGERQLSHLLHLGELLQRAGLSTQGPQALLRWFQERIDAHRQNLEPTQSQDQKTRLETDAQCVQITTYHKSKGLQFPLVFLPFMGAFKYKQDDDDEPGDGVEEDVRLIYVALTRAERAVWMGVAETRDDIDKEGQQRSALSWLLQRRERGDLSQQLDAMWGNCDDIALRVAPDAHDTRYQPAPISHTPKDACTPTRQAHAPWWSASFSTLTRGLVSASQEDESLLDALHDAVNEDDLSADASHPFDRTPATETPNANAADSAWQNFPAGARYGTLLHDLLQWQAEHGWPLAHDDASVAPATRTAWQRTLQRQCDWLQLSDAQRETLEPWLRRVVSTPLPVPLPVPLPSPSVLHGSVDGSTSPAQTHLRLQDFTTSEQWAEMAFHLPLAACHTSELDACIGAHVWPQHTRPALQARALQGMLTGFMDLVLAHPSGDITRYWVLDYKSNKLDNYDPSSLTRAVLDKRYDVQYTLYILALHRLLRVRLPNYDYDTHMGGAVYVFLRGIDSEGAGVHVCKPPRVLIEQLDDLFKGVSPARLGASV